MARLPVAQAQGFKVLFSFDGAGAWPDGGLTLNGSTLYGVTSDGDDGGTAFSIPTSGGILTTLYSFGGGPTNPTPDGDLTLSGSTLYGMTRYGGVDSAGTIFSIPVTGGTPTTVCSFDNTDGAEPLGSLTLIGSTLYGMTYGGGANNDGTIFSVPVTGGAPNVLFSFDGTHGANPGPSSLTLVGSTLYGVTCEGGAYGEGTIFSIPVTGGTPNVLFSFDGTHGTNPRGGLTLIGSTLYGTAWGGGANNYGTVFSIPVTGGTPNVLCSFDGTHGVWPTGSLTLIGSTLYGMTWAGNGGSTIFSL